MPRHTFNLYADNGFIRIHKNLSRIEQEVTRFQTKLTFEIVHVSCGRVKSITPYTHQPKHVTYYMRSHKLINANISLFRRHIREIALEILKPLAYQKEEETNLICMGYIAIGPLCLMPRKTKRCANQAGFGVDQINSKFLLVACYIASWAFRLSLMLDSLFCLCKTINIGYDMPHNGM